MAIRPIANPWCWPPMALWRRSFGLPREFLPHGDRGQILELCGLTPQHLAREITAAVARRTPVLAHEQGA